MQQTSQYCKKKITQNDDTFLFAHKLIQLKLFEIFKFRYEKCNYYDCSYFVAANIDECIHSFLCFFFYSLIFLVSILCNVI